MAIAYSNEIRVYGNRENLNKFKLDMAGDGENGPISFQNIRQEPRDTSNHKDEYGSGSTNWRFRNWGCPSNAIVAEVEDKGKFLVYTFGTRYTAPYGIYRKISEKYSELDFEINCSDDCIFSVEQYASRKGKLIKSFYMYWQCVPWRDDKFKDMLYRQDQLKDTLGVVQENIFYPGEYDEQFHCWVTKDVEFSDNHGIARYESITSEANLKLRS